MCSTVSVYDPNRKLPDTFCNHSKCRHLLPNSIRKLSSSPPLTFCHQTPICVKCSVISFHGSKAALTLSRPKPHPCPWPPLGALSDFMRGHSCPSLSLGCCFLLPSPSSKCESMPLSAG